MQPGHLHFFEISEKFEIQNMKIFQKIFPRPKLRAFATSVLNHSTIFCKLESSSHSLDSAEQCWHYKYVNIITPF